jgi:magnesium-transporting ATPase (P-type)
MRISVLVKSWKRAGLLVALLLAIGQTATAQVIDIKPEAPPGLGEKISMFLGWVYWLAIVASVAGVIAGAVMLWVGRDNGRQLLIFALISLAILASLGALLNAIWGQP